MKNDEIFKKIIGECIIDLTKNGINVILDNIDVLVDDSGIVYHGYFSGKEVYCCVKRKELNWMLIFIHEYCHFLQKKENSLVDREYDKNKTIQHISDWISGKKEISLNRIKKACSIIRNSELDCEIRTVDLMKKYGVELDYDKYIKSANAYVYFYNMVYKHRTWFKTAPTEIDDIIDLMPSKFLSNYETTPKKYEKIFLERCL